MTSMINKSTDNGKIRSTCQLEIFLLVFQGNVYERATVRTHAFSMALTKKRQDNPMA